MKKLLLIASLFLALSGAVSAQTTPSSTTQTKPKTAKSTTTAAKPATSTTAGPTKKDGTPDMRYKANKEAAKTPPTTHLKKDGTPDKRYKENKTPKKTS